MEDYSYRVKVEFCDGPLDFMRCYNFVKSIKCGAINTFTGIIRDSDLKLCYSQAISNKRSAIDGIHFETYESMARKQIINIIYKALGFTSRDCDYDENTKACVAVRIGYVPIGEAAIIICNSSTGRQLSHKATICILNKIKQNVVIWKKIVFSDGTTQWDLEGKSEATWLV